MSKWSAPKKSGPFTYDMKKDFLSITDLSQDELLEIIEEALLLKQKKTWKELSGKSVVAIYEKPSLRTRLSFESGMKQLGGVTMSFDAKTFGLGEREPIRDMATVIASMTDGIVLRVKSHTTLTEFAKYSSVPIINALSDIEHPCQTLADLMTIYEQKKRLNNLIVSFVGDSENNVVHSLALGCAMLGITFRVANPEGYGMKKEILEQCKALGHSVFTYNDPIRAVSGADVVVTDTWVSMGDEGEKEKRLAVFRPYQVTKKLMEHAENDAIFLHCMPVYRGNEVTDDVVDGKQSYIYQEAENRMHAQKALLLHLLS